MCVYSTATNAPDSVVRRKQVGPYKCNCERSYAVIVINDPTYYNQAIRF